MIVAANQTAIGGVVFLLALVIALVYAYLNIRQAKREVGSEIELAANRKPYYSDEELEGRKLDRTLTYGLLGLFVVALGLPLYWLNEPGRQAGEAKDLKRKFVDRGEAMFAPTAQGGFNCAFCHGDEGVGGAAPYTITNAQGEFVSSVTWKAPALNTVLLRYSREEVTYILTYGRPFSPMPAWGLKGNGPLNPQQIQNLVDYLESIQLTPKQAQAEVKEELANAMKEKDPTCVENKQSAAKDKLPADEVADFDATTVDTSDCPNAWKTEGEALFNLGYNNGFAGGAYSCGRCHTKGWSYGEKQKDGNGAFGPPLTNETNQFPGVVLGAQSQTDFVCLGSETGKLYGSNGQGTGRMPGYCVTPEEKADELESGEVGVNEKTAGSPDQGAMMTEEDVRKIVLYERGLDLMTSAVLGAFTWDVGFRGVLVVAVATAILCGSVFLLLATNTGVRLGFLLALTGLFGWMTIMGITWSMYGIGYKGPAPTWKVLDVNEGNIADTPIEPARSLPEPDELPDPVARVADSEELQKEFPGPKIPTLGDLVTTDTELADDLKKETGDWLLLPSSDKANGETAAAVATELGPEGRNMFAAPTDYVVLNTYTTGGKPGRTDQSLVGRVRHKLRNAVTLKNPPAYAVVQLQEAIVQEAKPGQAPPVPTADPDAEVISVVLERDLGALRLPSVGFTVVCGTLFAIFANMLHRRDKAVMRHRSEVAGAT